MELIDVTAENLEQEHICCAISNHKDCQVIAKKAWLTQRLADGLVFCKGNVRGKCFIEYLPAEKAWAPVDADGYMYIDCLWVAGQWQGQGNGALLLQKCITDSKAKGKRGLVILSSPKKKPFLADPRFLQHYGFQCGDMADPYFQLMYLPFEKAAPAPRFRPTVKQAPKDAKGFVLYYSHQCPYTAKYVPLVEEIAKANGVPFRTIQLQTAEQAQNCPACFTTYSLFYNGVFVTHEILSGKKMEKIIADLT